MVSSNRRLFINQHITITIIGIMNSIKIPPIAEFMQRSDFK